MFKRKQKHAESTKPSAPFLEEAAARARRRLLDDRDVARGKQEKRA